MHSCATRPLAAGVEHRVVRRAAAWRRSSALRTATCVARRQAVGAHQPRRTPTRSAGCRPSPTAPPRSARRRSPGPASRLQRVVRQVRRQVRARRATGPTPGPPPPCGMQNVLCRLRCETSAPNSPGRASPTSALRLAPSTYTWPPASCTSAHRSRDALLEDAVRRRVGDHDRGELVAVLRRSWRAGRRGRRRRRRRGRDDDDPHARPSPRWRRWCRARDDGIRQTSRCVVAAARVVARGSRAARRARPASRRWAAATPRRSR